MRRQAVSPSGLSKASSPRSPVWYRVSVCVCRCVFLPVHCTGCDCACTYPVCSVCVSPLIRPYLPWWDDNCLCVLLSHSASGRVRISKPNITFCSYLNCDYYSWRRMMSFPIRLWPLRKQPVVWCSPTKTAFLLLSYVCVSLCVHALYSFLFVYEMSHQCWTRGSLLLSQRLFF